MLDIGIDIVENKRIKRNCSLKFICQILTKKEQLIYKQKKEKQQLEFLCGRFAAKEAIIKAISKYENPHMLEIEILNDKSGKPTVKFKKYKLLISISHEKNYTIAEAILLK